MPIKTEHHQESRVRSRNVESYPNDSTFLGTKKHNILAMIRAISIKKASVRAINLALAKCLYARGVYVGILSSWSFAECLEIDDLFTLEI